MLNIIKDSINRTIDLYKEKNWYFLNFSLGFCIRSVLLSVFISVEVIFIFVFFNREKLHITDSYIEYVFNDPLAASFFFQLTCGLVIVSIGLYAIYLWYKMDNPETKPSFKEFRKIISKGNLVRFWQAIGIVCIIYFLTFYTYFDRRIEFFGRLNIQFQFMADKNLEPGSLLLMWISTLGILTRIILPYFCAFYIVFMDYHKKFKWKILVKYSKSILALLLIGFCLNAIVAELSTYLHIGLLYPFTTVFSTIAAIFVFQFFIDVMVTSWFMPVLGGIILFTFLSDPVPIPESVEEKMSQGIQD